MSSVSGISSGANPYQTYGLQPNAHPQAAQRQQPKTSGELLPTPVQPASSSSESTMSLHSDGYSDGAPGAIHASA